MEPLETTLLPWAQGVGRSNRPAPTIPPAGSKSVLRSAADRHHLSFASTVCFHCVLPLCASTVCFHCVEIVPRPVQFGFTMSEPFVFICVPIQLFESFAPHLKLHLRVFLEDLRIALAQQL